MMILNQKKATAKEYYESNRLKLWYRREYNLPPNDQRFLDITFDEVEFEWNVQQAYLEEQEEIRLSKKPSCRDTENCGYRGDPDPNYLPNTLCPECGAEMMLPKANQTIVADVSEEVSLASIGLIKDDIKILDD